MEKSYFIHLLKKHLSGTATVEEDQLVTRYYDLFASEPDVVALLGPGQQEALQQELYATIQRNIEQQERRQSRVITLKRWVRYTAAAVFIGLLVYSGLSLLWERPAHQAPVPAVASGKGQNHFFQLPDGSTVFLRHGSKLQYPPDFSSSGPRQVYLEGEAYFDVAHDPDHPFIVHTGPVQTTVLGTAFDVKAESGDAAVTVTVTRGKVKVEDELKTLDFITPDQQLVYDKQQARAIKTKVDAAAYLRWKRESDLWLDNVTLGEAASLLEDRFGIDILVQDPKLEKSRFTTVLLKEEQLEPVIQSICAFLGATYQFEKDHSVLIIRPGKTSTK